MVPARLARSTHVTLDGLSTFEQPAVAGFAEVGGGGAEEVGGWRLVVPVTLNEPGSSIFLGFFLEHLISLIGCFP